MTATITLQYRTNNAYDTILSVRDGVAVTRTDVTPAVFAEFQAGGFDAGDWDGRGVEDATDPDDYGTLVATRSGESLTVVDSTRWAERADFFIGYESANVGS